MMFVWVVTLNRPQGEYAQDIEEYIAVAATLEEAKEIVRKRESWKGVEWHWSPMETNIDPPVSYNVDVWHGSGRGRVYQTGVYTARKCDVVNSRVLVGEPIA